MSNYEEIRRLRAYELRTLCIKKNWYTEGTNEEYDHLLYDLAESKENLSTEDIIAIAEDIRSHSELSKDYDVAAIAWEVNRACYVIFVAQ